MTNSVISNNAVWQESGVAGAGPAQWYGSTAPDGDAQPWSTAPIGSLYLYKASSSIATWYEKRANGVVDADWVSWSGTPQNAAIIMGAGTTGTPITTATANKNFIDYKVSHHGDDRRQRHTCGLLSAISGWCDNGRR